jgi:hypothetical protein
MFVFAEPYVTWDILRQFFWGDADEVAAKYFDAGEHGRLFFKPEYNTEKKVRVTRHFLN